jgi:hypothetical protein
MRESDSHALPGLPVRAADGIPSSPPNAAAAAASPPSSCAAPPSAICISCACRVALMAIIHRHRPARALICALYPDKTRSQYNRPLARRSRPAAPALPAASKSQPTSLSTRPRLQTTLCPTLLIYKIAPKQGSARHHAARRPDIRTQSQFGLRSRALLFRCRAFYRE